MVRSSITAVLLVGVLAVSTIACSSGDRGSGPASSPSESSPGSEWLAVLASAADPNDLDARRADVVGALGGDASHVVVSPGGCFTGIPQRYGQIYVLAVWDASEQLVDDRVADAKVDAGWVGSVTFTCLD